MRAYVELEHDHVIRRYAEFGAQAVGTEVAVDVARSPRKDAMGDHVADVITGIHEGLVLQALRHCPLEVQSGISGSVSRMPAFAYSLVVALG